MRNRSNSEGFRQKLWDALRQQSWEAVADLTEHVGCSQTGARTYLNALRKRGYLGPGPTLTLIKHTGPLSPGYTAETGEFRDWNLEPLMPGAQLGAILTSLSLSPSAWLRRHGKSTSATTRVREMIEGKRPVTADIESAAQRDLADLTAAPLIPPTKA